MNMPAFTAQASLYRTSTRYRSSGSEFDNSPSAQSVIAAYNPGPQTKHDCNVCETTCLKTYAGCNVLAAVPAVGACVIGGWFTFGLSCAAGAAVTGAALAACDGGLALCLAACYAPWVGSCCPKPCSFPEPGGQGCCDEGEACVD